LNTDCFEQREQLYHQLSVAGRRDNIAVDLYSRLLASQQQSIGVMPRWLGLSRLQFEAMLRHYFPGVAPEHLSAGEILHQPERVDEMEELHTLFIEHSKGSEPALWAAQVLLSGCLGGDHLWQDMGFWSRKDLSAFIGHFFPALAEKNHRDMKWKKFFYKQLCAQEGVYTCRAPSCQVCPDYLECFGPE
jgi:nitrogen fixation protein NifQ